ncbi:MAG: HAD-IB family phosphatase [Nanoarchaeota archaeon]
MTTPIKAVIFDMDGTIVYKDTHQASWHALFSRLGVGAEMERINDKYDDKVTNVMTPENHQRQFAECVALLRGRTAPSIDDLFPTLPYTAGFSKFCSYLQQQGVPTGLVTLSLLMVAEKIQQEQSLQVVRANEIYVQDGKYTGEGKIHVLFGSKGKVVKEVYQELGATKETTAFIGDSLNDIGPWEEVGLPLGINLHHPNCKQHVRAYFDNFHQVKEYFEEQQLLSGKPWSRK